MLAKDIKALYEAYAQVYDEATDDLITDDLIEEVVEELIDECLEFGYTLEEAIDGVERAAELYFDAEELEEAKVTYGSDTESPAERTARAKARLGGMKATARKAAVKSAVSKVKSKAAGAAVSAYVAGKSAKAGAQRVGAAVSSAAKQKKAQVKSGVKRMLGAGLRAVAGGAGAVAQKARKVGSAASKAADRLGEETLQEKQWIQKAIKHPGALHKQLGVPQGEKIPAGELAAAAKKGGKLGQRARLAQTLSGLNKEEVEIEEAKKMKGKDPCWKGYEMVGTKEKGGREVPNCVPKEEVEKDNWDLVLEFLVSEGYADTNEDAIAVMADLDQEIIQSIIEDSATLSAAARKRAEELGRKRRSTKAYKQGLNRGTGRNERAAYNLSNIQRTHAANPSTQVSRSRKPAGYDTGAHKGDYGRFNRSKPEKNPKHDANK